LNPPSIRSLTAAGSARAVSTIVAAFSADPVARWFLPDAHAYLTTFPPIVRAFGGRAIEHGSAYGTDDLGGAALWLPPGVTPDEEAMGALMEAGLTEAIREDAYAFVERQSHAHPSEEHWYLPLIGVDPTRHGRGYGSALLRHALAVCDQAGVLAYLEATSPDSRRLYERHGFETTGVVQAGRSPELWPMVRRPRS
jgi:GNAT superfamily N-acetyltransferase